MNVITICYEYRDPEKFFELMRTINQSKIKLDWDNLNSTFKIIWEWHQKDDVIKLLPFLKETFFQARIKIENDVEDIEGESEIDDSMNIEEVEEESLEVVTEVIEPDETFEEDQEESDDVTNSDEVDQEILANEEIDYEVNGHDEESSTLATDVEDVDFEEKVEEDIINGKECDVEIVANDESTISDFDEDENVASKDVAEEDTTIEEECVEENPQIPEDDSFEETKEEPESTTEESEAVQSEVQECMEEEPSYDPEEELRNVFTPHIEKYDFRGDFKKAVTSFCKDQGIKSEPFISIFMLADVAPNLTALYKGVFKVHSRMNSALVKADINQNFKKWLKSTCPEVLDKCPDVNIINFLNLFRNSDDKF